MHHENVHTPTHKPHTPNCTPSPGTPPLHGSRTPLTTRVAHSRLPFFATSHSLPFSWRAASSSAPGQPGLLLLIGHDVVSGCWGSRCKLCVCVCMQVSGNSGEGTAAEKARLPCAEYLGHVHKSLHGLQLASKEYANVAGSTGKMFATTQLLCPADVGHCACADQCTHSPLSSIVSCCFPALDDGNLNGKVSNLPVVVKRWYIFVFGATDLEYFVLSENLMVALCTECCLKKKFWSTCGWCYTIKQHLTKNITKPACFENDIWYQNKKSIGCVTGGVQWRRIDPGSIDRSIFWT